MIIEKEFQLHHTKLKALCTERFDLKKSNETVFLALHGWLDNASSFDNLIKATPSLAWCAIDLAGHGLSEHRPDCCFYHLWDYVLDIVQLIEQLQVDGTNVCLVGHSMGGAVAMLVATVIPEKINNLILLDNVGPLTAESVDRVSRLQKSIKAMGKVQKKKEKYHQSQDSMIKARMNGFTQVGFDAAEKLVFRGSKASDEGEFSWTHDPKLKLATPFAMDKDSVESFAAKVSCPVLLLLAKDGIYREQYESIKKRVHLFPNKTVEWLEGSHHFHLENKTFAAVVSSIENFIRKTSEP